MKSKYVSFFIIFLIMCIPIFGQENSNQTEPIYPSKETGNIPIIQVTDIPELPDMQKIQEEINSELENVKSEIKNVKSELREKQLEMKEMESEFKTMIPPLQKFAQSLKKEKRLWGNYISKNIDIKIPANPGMLIFIEHTFGNIDVRKGVNNQILITGEKRVSDDDNELAGEFLDKMKLDVEENGNTIRIKTNYPDEYKNKIKNFSISYKIEIPEDIDLNLKNSFGNTDLKGISGRFSISNAFGKLSTEDLTGESQLKNKFGELTAENIKGETNINNSHGSIDIKNITGNLTAGTKFGKINIIQVKGTADITGGHGNITIDDIRDDAKLSNSFSSIKCSNIGGEAQISNSHGKVEALHINGNTKITNKFGSVNAENIKGNLLVENSHSPVEAKQISGNIDASNSFSPVTITNTTGDIIVSNSHGNITVKNVLEKESYDERLVKLETTFGVIRLNLPGNISAGIKASTTFGKIKCDFPVYLENTSSNSLKISAKLGDAKDNIELTGKNTSIYIEKVTSY